MGGTELYTAQVAQAQARSGHQVTVIYPSGLPTTQWQEKGVTVQRVFAGSADRLAVFGRTFFAPKLRQAIDRAVKSADLVHIQHLMGWPIPSATLARPYLVTLHDYWFACANAQLLTNYDETICDGPDQQGHNCGRCFIARAGFGDRPIFAPLFAPILRRRNQLLHPILQYARALIAPTPFVKTVYQGFGITHDHFVVLPHGLDVPTPLPTPAPRPDTRLRLIYVGSIAWQKGVHLLIEAMKQLDSADFQLTVVGGLDSFPEYSQQLQQDAPPNVTFLGRLDRAAVWQQLVNHDVAVMPTLWYETFVLTVDEQFAVGLPVVASDVGVLRTKIRHEENGLLFALGSAQQLAEQLRRLRAEPGLLAQLKQGIDRPISVDEHVAQLDQLYHTALGHSNEP